MSEKRPSRATRAISTTTIVAAQALKKTGQHKVTEALFALLGVTMLTADGYFLAKHPPAGVGDQVFHGIWIVIALALIPGAAVRAASGIGKIGGAIAEAWKKKQ